MCPHEEKLTAWLLGDLSPEEHQALSRHLETCASCRSVSEELSRVLTPLRSGLAKDRDLHIAAKPGRASPLQAFRAFWTTPQAGLRRVAVLALFFGVVATLVGVVYQRSLQTEPSDGGVTYVSYLQPAVAPPPALYPEEKIVVDADCQTPALAEAPLPAEPPDRPTVSVGVPLVPAPERVSPPLNRLIVGESVRQATQRPFETKRAATAATGKSKVAAAKQRDREKSESPALPQAAPADALAVQPIRLAGAALAATNAVSTNSIPTNAVKPTAHHTP